MNAKKLLIAILLLAVIMPVWAQTKGTGSSAKATPTKDCFREWLDLFRDRGGKPVTDGTQEVIITLRRQEKSVCYLGKIEVVSGKIKPPLWVQKEDGSYDTFAAMGKKLDPEFTANIGEDDLFAITDGTSISFRTSEQEYGRLFFYKFLNEKPKANKQAPPASALIKN
jgi:hypothetical protein